MPLSPRNIFLTIFFHFLTKFFISKTFAIRFKSPEISQEFKAAFTSAQVEMKTLLAGGDSETGAAEADEAAAAIASLAVKSEVG